VKVSALFSTELCVLPMECCYAYVSCDFYSTLLSFQVQCSPIGLSSAEHGVLYEVRTIYIYILILVLKADLRQLIIRRVLTTGNRLRSQAGQSEVCVG